MSLAPTIGESECFCGKIEKPHGGKKKTTAAYKKPDFQGKNGYCCATYVMVCARSVSFLWRGRLEVLTLS
jgi:hypothetical protein